jgi:tetratricopeptide (TPR) repeat protein/tRNA A-37 threonylcarbamoyl transferase component Bud32
VVYLAEQERPRRTVALKVIRPGFVSEGLLRRFEHEATVLARLQHPGIAQIYEAGTAEGAGVPGAQPYFAMELVRGPTLTEYARTARLGLAEKLELMARVCDAVHHAHQKGVIHRDLKPGNILVALDEGSGGAPTSGTAGGAAGLPQPKVLDFGVARITDSDSAVTMHTDAGQLVGTLAYMSPEQAAGDPSAVDVRSDVYSLGVMLYEMLSGRLPREAARRSGPEAVRAVREEEPASLSSVDRSLRGDVETIVSKALQREKERRYASADALGADLRRHLRNEPIQARPPTAGYQLRKFARRNKTLVGAAGAVVLALVLGVLGTGWQAVKAVRAQGETQRMVDAGRRINGFLQDVLMAADPALTRGAPATVRDVLDRQESRIDGAFGDDPLVRSELHKLVGGAYYRMGVPDKAERHLRAAVEEYAEQSPEPTQDSIDAMLMLSTVLLDGGQIAEGAEVTRRALEASRRVLGPSNQYTIDAANNMAAVQLSQGHAAEAEATLRETLRLAGDSLAPASDSAMALRGNLSAALFRQGRVKEAVEVLREVYTTAAGTLGEDHPDVLRQGGELAIYLDTLGETDEAERLLRRIVELKERVLTAEHPDTQEAMHKLAAMLRSHGRAAEGLALVRRVVELRERLRGADHPLTLRALQTEAECLRDSKQGEEAERTWRELIDRAAAGPAADRTEAEGVFAAYSLGLYLLQSGRAADAEGLLARAAERVQLLVANGGWHAAIVGEKYGMALRDIGKYAEAEGRLLRAYEEVSGELGHEHEQSRKVAAEVAALYRSWGRGAETGVWEDKAAAPGALKTAGPD